MKTKYLIALTTTILSWCFSSYGQGLYGEWKRKNWSASYLFGLQAGDNENHYGNSHTVSAKRYIGISDLLGAHLLADYAYIQGDVQEGFGHYAIGGGLTVFPAYITRLFKKEKSWEEGRGPQGKRHNPNKDRYFLDLSVRYGINDPDFNLVSSALLYVYTFPLRKYDTLSAPRDGLSPVIGAFLYSGGSNTPDVNSLLFYTLGLSYHF